MNYEPAHIAFLEANVKGKSFAELSELFNQHFGLSLPVSSVKSACKNRGLSNGRITRFIKGGKPWSAGTKGLLKGSSTSFKKGHKPHNWCLVGTEKPDKDGYFRIKIAEPNVWEFKHLLIYVSAFGSIPPKHIIVFADGNKLNCEPENLVCISRREHVHLNRWYPGNVDVDLTKAKISYVRLLQKKKFLERKRENTWER